MYVKRLIEGVVDPFSEDLEAEPDGKCSLTVSRLDEHVLADTQPEIPNQEAHKSEQQPTDEIRRGCSRMRFSPRPETCLDS